MEYILNEPLMDPAALVLLWGNCAFEFAFDCDGSNFVETEFHISNIIPIAHTHKQTLTNKYFKINITFEIQKYI